MMQNIRSFEMKTNLEKQSLNKAEILSIVLLFTSCVVQPDQQVSGYALKLAIIGELYT